MTHEDAGSVLVRDLHSKVDIEHPRWDQGTYMGRAKHFVTITSPLNLFRSHQQLEDAKGIVDDYRYIRRYTRTISFIVQMLRVVAVLQSLSTVL